MGKGRALYILLFSGQCFPVENLGDRLPDGTGNTKNQTVWILRFHGDGRNEDLVTTVVFSVCRRPCQKTQKRFLVAS